MSYQIGLDTIRLEPTPRLAHTEYCSNDALMRHVRDQTGHSFEDAWELDWVWKTDDGPVPWPKRGRTTDMGHGKFLEGGSDLRPAMSSPFTDPQQVLEFDAVEEYGLPDFDDLVAYYERSHRDMQNTMPDQVVPGGYYRTIVSGAIDAFGWDMLLLAAADQDGFERVLDSFFRLSLHHFRAWARTSIEVFNCHDDMVWTEGPFMAPDFYRRVIFPRYAELWSVLKKAGKKILYTADGDYTMFLDDLAKAGTDGFIFEPITSLQEVVKKFGRSHVIVGSKVDCRTLTFGTQDQIRAEIDATIDLALDCPGFMFAVGNHLPSNVPVENALFYLQHLRSRWNR